MRALLLTLPMLWLALALPAGKSFAQSGPGGPAPAPPAGLAQVSILDLKTAQRIALANSPTLSAAAERVNQASERINQARAAYWPTLDAEGSVSRVERSENALAGQGAQGANSPFPVGVSIDDSEDFYRASLVARWTLFDGFRRHFSKALARYGEDASQAALAESRRLLLSAVADSFYLAQLARERIAITEADEAFNQRQLEEARVRYRVGTGPLSDILSFEVQVNAARSERNSFQEQYRVALVGLASLMGIPDAGLPPGLSLAGLGAETEAEMTPPQPESHLAYAVEHRPDVLQTESFLQQREAGIGIARSRFYPNLQLAGSLDGERVNSGRFEEDDFGNTVGLFLTYRFFSGGERRAQLAEAKYQRKEADENLRAAKVAVAQDVREAIVSVRTAQQELELQRQNAALVMQNRDLVEKEYQAGQASLVRLNEAQRNLNQARGRLALARVGLRQALKNLAASTARILLPFETP